MTRQTMLLFLALVACEERPALEIRFFDERDGGSELETYLPNEIMIACDEYLGLSCRASQDHRAYGHVTLVQFANPGGGVRGRVLANTPCRKVAWITAEHVETAAHELAHLLGRNGHTDDVGSLLHNPGWERDDDADLDPDTIDRVHAAVRRMEWCK